MVKTGFEATPSNSSLSYNNNCSYNDLSDNNNYKEYIKILVIKLSNLKSNYNMLVEVAKVVGGTVRITGKQADVI
ncbi:LAGLIDADG endonuclease [Pyrenophora seminiperda CCB06]|uniref:LAGLIDADG endonuclease (Mitochondrion) n=1 Tax=Pyrenophora seminiperda CCB06 TaxID=1302712 RepID=A0A3M7M5J8_9PLEO|nr:LAGLIDADG endonuclease [Pyrenophora seminiperda CCB06]